MPPFKLTKEQQSKFFTELANRLGCDYCWPSQSNNYSGKDLPFAKYHNVYDCSGLVTCSLRSAGGPDLRADHNAWALSKICDDVELMSMKPGDLLFYGNQKKVTHVAVYLGPHAEDFDKRFSRGRTVISASSGDSRTVTPDIAKSMGANVRQEKTIRYRSDLLKIGRLFSAE